MGLPSNGIPDLNAYLPNVNGGSSAADSSLDSSSFQQPFLPQDLWQMPMTLEWDWADMTGDASYSDGFGMSGVMSDINGDGNPQNGQ